MRNLTVCLTLLLPAIVTWSQTPISPKPYFQQQVNYNINVSLNDKLHELTGYERIEYINRSPDTLKSIWFHLWPNAYKNDKTAFSDQLLENGDTKFYFSNKEERGYINRLDFKIGNATAEMKDHPQHIDIIEVILPEPLLPGATAIISTPFHVKLPSYFSRSGHVDQQYMAAQWYPKPAVYDREGWHAMPYLDQGEFYGEFGNYDVSITLPKNYVVAATGDLQDQDERQWLLTRSKFEWSPRSKKVRNKGGGFKTVRDKAPTSSTETKTLRYIRQQVHDFAWFADKRVRVLHDTCQLSSGKTIDVYSFYLQNDEKLWKSSISYTKDAIRTRSAWIGEYPYSTVSVVQGPKANNGGMEYPGVTLISGASNDRLLEYLIAHEVGHNWFYSVLGSNERQHPWLDEGLNTFYDNRNSRLKFKDGGEVKLGPERFSLEDAERILFMTKLARQRDQPIELPAPDYANINYSLSSYYKAAAWLEYLEQQVGRDAFDKAMRDYYQQWKFKHPGPRDFKQSIERSTGRNLDSSFALLDQKGELPNQRLSGTRFGLLWNPKFIAGHLRHPSASIIAWTPAVGINAYDKFMAGVLVTNMLLPPPKLQFLLAPLYSFGAKRLAGTGLVNYRMQTHGAISRVDIGVAASTFSIDDFKDDEGNKVIQGFHKIVPRLRLTLKEKNERSTIERYIQFKSFLIRVDALQFYRDTVVTGVDTAIFDRFRTVGQDRTLNQLSIVIENFRALYPYRGELRIEQGKSFVRAAFTGKYFFNYGPTGGLDVRFFAGKFFYTTARTFSKQFETDRYHLNMTGANGYEDYTYSDYFIGRNEFEGSASQQIMVRDGGFKVRTDLLAAKVGRTDDWLIAANFSSSILKNNFPLKIFVDIGTYAEAWDRNANTDRFLFDAGIHIPIFKETMNIYIPLLYSRVYKEYIQSTLEKDKRFWQKISFSIDISNFKLRKIDRNLDF